MQEPPASLRDILGNLLHVFEKINGDSPAFRDSLEALQGIHHLKSDNGSGDLSLDEGSQGNLFHLLAVCLNEARLLKSDHLAEALHILADASRDSE